MSEKEKSLLSTEERKEREQRGGCWSEQEKKRGRAFVEEGRENQPENGKRRKEKEMRGEEKRKKEKKRKEIR